VSTSRARNPQWSARRADPTSAAAVAATPFDAEFTDSDGREYMCVSSGPVFDECVLYGDINALTWADPTAVLVATSGQRGSGERNLGAQIFQFRIPRTPRDTDPIPPPLASETGGTVWMTHAKTRRHCRATFETVVWSPKRRLRGYMICPAFYVLPTSD